jgi:hypothetical protein
VRERFDPVAQALEQLLCLARVLALQKAAAIFR